MKHQIILDFDNTMGVPGCDVDDGLALLYLLGHADKVDVVGCTCSFGNSDIETVWENTQQMFAELELDIPVFKGSGQAANTENLEACISPAARFLAEAVAQQPGQIEVLVTGSVTNIFAASLVDPEFFSKVKSITHMGGVTAQLVFETGVLDELNFSCDPYAVCKVFSSEADVSIATSQHCLPSYFGVNEFQQMLGLGDGEARGRICGRCVNWFDTMKEKFHLDGTICWDVVAAAMIVEPELFVADDMNVVVDEAFLAKGLLWRATKGEPSALVHTPAIADKDVFVNHVWQAWKRGIALLDGSAI